MEKVHKSAQITEEKPAKFFYGNPIKYDNPKTAPLIRGIEILSFQYERKLYKKVSWHDTTKFLTFALSVLIRI